MPVQAIWHDVECGSYAADLPVWRSLADAAGGPVLDVGAGTGRVALDLARRGHAVTALDRDPELLEVLAQRARGLPVHTVVGDARDFRLDTAFALCIVPMQTTQLLGGPPGRRSLLGRTREHLRPGGVLAASLAEDLLPFEPADPAELPPPDLGERDGWVYASQPVAVREGHGAMVLERRRESVAPDGARRCEANTVTLDRLSAIELEREGSAAGFEVLESLDVPPTADHVGSRVVVLRAGSGRRPGGRPGRR